MSDLSGLDTMELRAQVLRVAGEALTTVQFRVFVLYWFSGWTEQSIADHYGCSQAAVHFALWGQKKSKDSQPVGGAVRRIKAALEAAGGGAMSKLGKAIEEDPELTEVLNNLKNEPKAKTPPAHTTLGWYRNARHEHVASLAVLHLMAQLADAKRSLTITTLAAEVPRMTMSVALSQLRVLGFIATDGVSITILKTPTPDLDNA